MMETQSHTEHIFVELPSYKQMVYFQKTILNVFKRIISGVIQPLGDFSMQLVI